MDLAVPVDKYRCARAVPAHEPRALAAHPHGPCRPRSVASLTHRLRPCTPPYSPSAPRLRSAAHPLTHAVCADPSPFILCARSNVDDLVRLATSSVCVCCGPADDEASLPDSFRSEPL